MHMLTLRQRRIHRSIAGRDSQPTTKPGQLGGRFARQRQAGGTAGQGLLGGGVGRVPGFRIRARRVDVQLGGELEGHGQVCTVGGRGGRVEVWAWVRGREDLDGFGGGSHGAFELEEEEGCCRGQ